MLFYIVCTIVYVCWGLIGREKDVRKRYWNSFELFGFRLVNVFVVSQFRVDGKLQYYGMYVYV